MPESPTPHNYAVPSIQTVYTLYEYTDVKINELYTAAHNLDVDVANLKSRVTALENKAGG
jgi:hypothetical protein